MNTIQKRSLVALSLVATTPWVTLHAQETEDSDDEIFELSPFTVTSEGDEGYRAQSTTAGSRLNTQMKDVAASVTVLTDAFLDDLGADNLVDALGMVAGAENFDITDETSAGSVSGGFTGGDFGDVNTGEGSVRVRGLGRADKAANYLPILTGTDRYNIERAEYLRGPNSILFGLGSPAGLVNYTTIKANTNRDTHKIEFKIDEFSTKQIKIDINRVLIEDKLAFRLAGKRATNKYSFDHAEQSDRRLFATATFKPFEGTVIRGSYESVNLDGRTPTYRPLQDNASAWLQAYNEIGASLTPEQLTDNLFWNPTQLLQPTNANNRNDPVDWQTSTFYDETYNETGAISGFVLSGDNTTRDDNTSAIFRRTIDGRPDGFVMIFDDPNSDEVFRGVGTFLTTVRQDGGPAFGGNASASAPRRGHFLRSSHPLENRPGYTDPQVTSEAIFPYNDIDIGSLPGSFRREDNEKLYFALEQKINEDLYFAFDYVDETWNTEQNFPILSQTRSINIDVNETTIDGQPNPNFLRPFIYGRNLGEDQFNKNKRALAQVNYDLDFADKTDRFAWLGSHRFTGFASSGRFEQLQYRWHYKVANPPTITNTIDGFEQFDNASDLTYNGTNNRGFDNHNIRRWVNQIFYIGDPVQLGDTGLRITGIPQNVAPNTGAIQTLYWDDRAPSQGGRVWRTTENPLIIDRLPLARRSDNRNFEELEEEGYGASWQGFLFNRRLVTLLGWREDTVAQDFYGINLAAPRVVNGQVVEGGPDWTVLWDGVETNRGRSGLTWNRGLDGNLAGFAIEDYSLLSSNENTKATVTKGAVFHVTPKLRLFVNESENFRATNPRNSPLGTPIDPNSGQTVEYGFGGSLLEGKLNYKLTIFQTDQLFETDPQGTRTAALRLASFENNFRRAFEQADNDVDEALARERAIADGLTGDALNDIDVADFLSDEERSTQFIDQWVTVDTQAGTLTNEQYVQPQSVAATRTSSSKGAELELTYNPNRNLRLSFNLSKLENERRNLGSEVREFLDFRAPFYSQWFLAGLDRDGNFVTDDPATTVDDRFDFANERLLSTNLTQVVLDEFVQGLASEGEPNFGIAEYTAKLVANYTFREGRFKGFSVGTNLVWEDGKAIGAGQAPVDISFGGLPAIPVLLSDPSQRIFGDSTFGGGMKFGYRTKIFDDKFDWRIQVNAQRLFSEQGLRITRANPDGSPVYGLARPTTWQLTNTISW